MSKNEEVKRSLMEILEKVVDGYLEEANEDTEPTELIVIIEDSNLETFSVSVVPGPPDVNTVAVLRSVLGAVSEELDEDEDEVMEYLH